MAEPEETHDSGDSIGCPWCGGHHSDLWDYEIDPDNAEDVECDHCGRYFELSAEATLQYTASPIVGWSFNYVNNGLERVGPVRLTKKAAKAAFNAKCDAIREECVVGRLKPGVLEFSIVGGYNVVTLSCLNRLHGAWRKRNPFAIDGESPKPEDFK